MAYFFLKSIESYVATDLSHHIAVVRDKDGNAIGLDLSIGSHTLRVTDADDMKKLEDGLGLLSHQTQPTGEETPASPATEAKSE